MTDLGSDIKGLPTCSECGAPRDEVCRTRQQAVAMPPCRSRLLAEICDLRAMRDQLQASGTREVLRRRELERAARYAIDNVQGHEGILDHLRHALVHRS